LQAIQVFYRRTFPIEFQQIMKLEIKAILFVLGVSRLRFTTAGQAVRSRFYVFALYGHKHKELHCHPSRGHCTRLGLPFFKMENGIELRFHVSYNNRISIFCKINYYI
jgi:hypothetical protein